MKHQVHLDVGKDLQWSKVPWDAATEVPSDDDVGIDASEFSEGGDVGGSQKGEWRMMM